MTAIKPNFANLVAIDQNPLTRALDDIWARLGVAEAAARDAAALARSMEDRMAALERQLAKRDAEIDRLIVGRCVCELGGARWRVYRMHNSDTHLLTAMLSFALPVRMFFRTQDQALLGEMRDLLARSDARIDDLERRLKALQAASGSDADLSKLRDELASLLDRLNRLEGSFPHVGSLEAQLEKMRLALVQLRTRLDTLTLDDLVDRKAVTSHRDIEEDDGTVVHFTAPATPRSPDENMRQRSIVGEPLPPPPRPASVNVLPDLAISATQSAHAPAPEPVAALEFAATPVAVVDRSQAKPIAPFSVVAAATRADASADMLHSYSRLNELVNGHGARLAAVESFLSALGDLSTKADLAYIDRLIGLLNDKFRQLADVSNRNVDVLARICNAKADQDTLRGLMETLRGMLASGAGDSNLSMAAGRIHFRCLSCDRVASSVPGSATAGFIEATHSDGRPVSAADMERPLFSNTPDEVALWGADKRVYRGRRDGATLALGRPASARAASAYERVRTPPTRVPAPPRGRPSHWTTSPQ